MQNLLALAIAIAIVMMAATGTLDDVLITAMNSMSSCTPQDNGGGG
jgi:hypothetical protein